jgi:soluble lytic murein transglycosylase-like protein
MSRYEIVLQYVKTQARTVMAITAVMVLLATVAGAQSQTGEDPVAKAMKTIEASIGERARAADRVLAATKLVNESATARKQGDRTRAKEALREAEKIAAAAEEFDRSALIDELARIVASEQAVLNPRSDQVIGQFPTDKSIKMAVPQSVVARMNTYRDAFTRIFGEERVPVGLLGVALVESGFNPFALSPKGARGIWQFMPATAERYGLAVSQGVDHRTHPEHSTRAAARYLRDLYAMFGDWKLAIAGYNAGEGRVQRIIKKTGIRDFEEMSRRGLLPLETRKYVPAVLAAWSRVIGQTLPNNTNPVKADEGN